MSDSKWVKLLKLAARHAEAVPTMRYKLVNGPKIIDSFTEPFAEQVDEQWFREPIFYKEIEWIEFPARYLAGTKNEWIVQDLAGLEAELAAGAKFPIQRSDDGIRIIAYVRA